MEEERGLVGWGKGETRARALNNTWEGANAFQSNVSLLNNRIHYQWDFFLSPSFSSHRMAHSSSKVVSHTSPCTLNHLCFSYSYSWWYESKSSPCTIGKKPLLLD
jgi:hypothetical protein